MKIQGRKSSQIGSLGPLGAPAAQAESKPAEAAQPATDQVDISSSAQLRKLSETVKALPSVRTDKVEGLRDAIEDGSYHVESEKLARKVVDDVLSEALLKQFQAKGLAL